MEMPEDNLRHRPWELCPLPLRQGRSLLRNSPISVSWPLNPGILLSLPCQFWDYKHVSRWTCCRLPAFVSHYDQLSYNFRKHLSCAMSAGTFLECRAISPAFKLFFFISFVFCYIFVEQGKCRSMCVEVRGHFWELVLSFHHVGLHSGFQVWQKVPLQSFALPVYLLRVSLCSTGWPWNSYVA